MIYDIDFDDPSATHNSCITAYHIHRYTTASQAAKKTGSPNNPAPANGAGGGGVDVGATILSKSAIKRAREKEKKARRGKSTDSPAGKAGDKCVWFLSSRGCDPIRRKNGACKSERHALPTTEEERLAILARLSRFNLTAKADYPTSCPP